MKIMIVFIGVLFSSTLLFMDEFAQGTASSTSLGIISGKYRPQVNLSLLPLHSLNMSMGQQLKSRLVTANKVQLDSSQKLSTTLNVYGTVTNPQGGKVAEAEVDGKPVPIPLIADTRYV